MVATADAPSVKPSGRTRWAAASSPPERSSVHHYAGEHRPTLRMPSAQLHALVISLIEPIEDPALADPSIALGARRDADDITSAGARGGAFAVEATPLEIRVAHSVPIGVVNGVPLGNVDLDAALDRGPSIRTRPRLDTVSDSASVSGHVPARGDAIDLALDDALVTLDALDDASALMIDEDLDDDPAGDLDDFEAQPTAYRVRTTTLDGAIATPTQR